MSARIIDGHRLAEEMRAEVKAQAAAFAAQTGYPPGLGVVLVGDNAASAQYVRMKRRACESVGIVSSAQLLPADSDSAAVEAAVSAFNADPRVHGILVQLPLPSQVDEEAVLRQVGLEKDVDGLHPINIGLLAQKGREPLFTPATPTGCMILLQALGVPLAGANAVVLGRSNIVGMPVALMLMRENATVTMCHSRTRDLPAILKNADVVIAAMGRAQFIVGEWLKPGTVVIDVGTNRIDDATDPRGYRFVGDVDFDSAREIASAITQVPGGVGPMTITMLLVNCLRAAWRSVGIAPMPILVPDLSSGSSRSENAS